MPIKRPFGVSTYLYRHLRLSRDHLLEIARHGFETVELFATRSHFDYHNPAAIAELHQWLGEAGLALHGIHLPADDNLNDPLARGPTALASANEEIRTRAVEEVEHALHIARRIPSVVVVAHLGPPRTRHQSKGGNNRDAACRSVEELAKRARPLGVRLALEVIPNNLSRAASLVDIIECELEAPGVGICLDFGHAHLEGDLLEAIEVVSGHLVTADMHDNRGRVDEHLVPFDGTIDWAGALTVLQKVGYDGPLLFELAGRATPRETLQKARKARERIERLLGEQARAGSPY